MVDPRTIPLNVPRVRVYVAGPYTTGDVARNVAVAMEVAHKLIEAGYAPYCPHLSHFLHMQKAQPYSVWMEQDLAWLPFCHALYRIPGESPGADMECEVAGQLGKPVVKSLEELQAHFNATATPPHKRPVAAVEDDLNGEVPPENED